MTDDEDRKVVGKSCAGWCDSSKPQMPSLSTIGKELLAGPYGFDIHGSSAPRTPTCDLPGSIGVSHECGASHVGHTTERAGPLERSGGVDRAISFSAACASGTGPAL